MSFEHVLIITKRAHAMKMNNPRTILKVHICDIVPDKLSLHYNKSCTMI